MRLVDIMLRSGPWGDGFGAKPEGLSLEKLRASPHAEDLGPLERRLPDLLRTEGKRIDLAPDHLVADLPRLKSWQGAAPAGEGLVLIGRRQLRNMNSWLHNLPVLAKGPERCTLLICPTDAERLAIADGREVRIKSRSGELTVTAEISEEMMPGVVSLPHGFGHRYDGTRLSVASTLQPGVSLNDLTDSERIDVASGTCAANGVPVEVEPIGL
jgi:anaerobic selenocysteine-containing dehydrogenase